MASEAETDAGDALASIQGRFLERHFVHWPEEATTLGMHEHDGRLKDLSDASIDDELDLHRESRDALSKLDQAALTAEERLDITMMRALHDFHLHVVGENKDHLINIEMSLHPYLMLQLQQRVARDSQRWSSVSSRVDAVPRFLKQQQVLLQRGVQAGRTPDYDAVAFIAENQIPHVASFLKTFFRGPAAAGVKLDDTAQRAFETRCQAAAEAYAEHAEFLRNEVCPVAENRTLGEDEYAWRLKTTLGVNATPKELIEQGQVTLASLRDELLATARSISDAAINSVDDALAYVMREKETPLTHRDGDVIAAYRSIQDRALSHMRDHALFHFGDEVNSLEFVAPPAAFSEISEVTNVAAPLLDDSGSAFFLIQPNAALHFEIQATPLAVHEGVPGHGLQSIWWQSNRERRPNLVRFLCVPDDVAFARQYFGAMMNIEGYATYAEALMREHGFFNEREALFAIWAQMVHAARVVVDASLHCNQMTVPTAVQYLAEQLRLPALAEGEVARYRRLPLQSICYLLGRLEILDLREGCRARDGAAFSLADFHERVFAAGPVAAGHLKRAWLT